jgi:hypothetical protein
MSTLAVGTFGNQTRFEPGAEIRGKILWILDREPASVEVRLFWYTEGKGTQDVEVVEVACFEKPGVRGEKEFNFQLPRGPYGFSGKLISLLWALEVLALPSKESHRLDLTVGPGGNEILLGTGQP